MPATQEGLPGVLGAAPCSPSPPIRTLTNFSVPRTHAEARERTAGMQQQAQGWGPVGPGETVTGQPSEKGRPVATLGPSAPCVSASEGLPIPGLVSIHLSQWARDGLSYRADRPAGVPARLPLGHPGVSLWRRDRASPALSLGQPWALVYLQVWGPVGLWGQLLPF